MKAKDISALAELCRAIEARAKADFTTACDLAALRDADFSARILARTENPGAVELRVTIDAAVNALESGKGGAIKSRLDSHHWDLGFMRVESDFEVVSVIDGDVLCRAEDEETELCLIGREEVRVEFGDGLPGDGGDFGREGGEVGREG